MVSKRKSDMDADNEVGSSTKRAKIPKKIKTKQENLVVDLKKRRRDKIIEEKPVEEVDFTNNFEIKEDGELSVTETETDRIIPNYDFPNWPAEHISNLLCRIEDVLPPNDTIAYKSRINKLDWNKIAFEGYSDIDCQLMWKGISKRIRKYRILRELIDEAKKWLSKPASKGSKKNRHPDLPRKPLSTFMIFYLKKRNKVQQENPGVKMSELSKLIAEMYKKLTAKRKKKYEELAILQKKEYDEKMKEFYRLHPELKKSPMQSAIQHANDGILEKTPTPFKLFYQNKLKSAEHDPEYDKNTFKGKCKKKWRTMSDKKKITWINLSCTKETEYHEQIRQQMAENADYIPVTIKSVLTKEERAIRDRMAGKPEKPPNSAYNLFMRVMLANEDVNSINSKERMLFIVNQWKNCTDVEKMEYNDKVKRMLEHYKLQYEKYLESLPEDERQEELQNNQPKRKKTPSKQKPSETIGKNINVKAKKNVNKAANSNTAVTKSETLYDGEPELPPTTSFLMFAKTYQSCYPDRDDAHVVWNNMSDDQKKFHRIALWNMKKVYIESYKNFLTGLTPKELKQYSEWKKSNTILNQLNSEATSEESGESDCEEEVNSDDY